jgi:hypothetical protein
MPQGKLTITGRIGGAPFNSTVTRNADGEIDHAISLPAAKTGTLSTRTNDTSGVVTLESDHGLAGSDVFDLYWNGGMRYDVDVDSVDGNDVTFSGGDGDVLPTQGSDVTAQEQQVIDTDFDGDKLKMIGFVCAKRSHVGCIESGTNELEQELVNGEPWFWADGGPTVNPLAGEVIDEMRVTQAETVATTLYIGIVYDSTV